MSVGSLQELLKVRSRAERVLRRAEAQRARLRTGTVLAGGDEGRAHLPRRPPNTHHAQRAWEILQKREGNEEMGEVGDGEDQFDGSQGRYGEKNERVQ